MAHLRCRALVWGPKLLLVFPPASTRLRHVTWRSLQHSTTVDTTLSQLRPHRVACWNVRSIGTVPRRNFASGATHAATPKLLHPILHVDDNSDTIVGHKVPGSQDKEAHGSSSDLMEPIHGSASLTLTPSAIQRLIILQTRAAGGEGDPSNFALRVRVDGGGCSGFKYSFELERSAPQSDDNVITVDGARVVVDAASLDLVRGSTLDWVDEMMRNCFTLVNNPQSASSCGCGSSFAPKE